jgi:hypothetical protein
VNFNMKRNATPDWAVAISGYATLQDTIAISSARQSLRAVAHIIVSGHRNWHESACYICITLLMAESLQ